jgi:hypothetical protein
MSTCFFGFSHRPLRLALGLALGLTAALALAASPDPTPDWRPIVRDAHSTTWELVGNPAVRYVESASGLDYRSADGEWLPSEERIDLLPDGSAAACESAHQVRFASNLNAAGAIELVSATKQLFRTHPLGLFYYDAATGKTAALAKLQDAFGELVAPNQIVYRGALAGLVRADVRFTITRGGWESDVIILECPPGPELFGLEPKTTRLEVWTEFLDPPVPARQVRVLKAETDPALRAAMVEPDLVDETPDFGDLWLPQGKAFVCGVDSSTKPGEAARIEVARVGTDPGAVPVAKRWLEIEGRQVLVESVDWLDLWPRLSQLPASKD